MISEEMYKFRTYNAINTKLREAFFRIMTEKYKVHYKDLKGNDSLYDAILNEATIESWHGLRIPGKHSYDPLKGELDLPKYLENQQKDY